VRRLARVAASAIVIAVVGLACATPAYAAAHPGTLDVSIVPTASGDLAAGDPLNLFLTVDNHSSQPVAAGTATLTVDQVPLTTRVGLADWFSGTTHSNLASSALTTATTPSVAAGLSGVVEVSVPAAQLDFDAPGIYAIGVSVQTPGQADQTARTAIAWNLDTESPVPLAIAVPLTVPATNTTFLSAKVLAADTAPDGILTRELTDLTSTQVSIGIDPRIIASIRVLGKSAPTSAIEWMTELAALPNPTFPLAWADADLTVALQAGQSTVPTVGSLAYAIDPSLFKVVPKGQPTPTPAPTSDPSDPNLPTAASLTSWKYTLPQLAWPADDTVATADLPKLTASGISRLILSSTNVEPANSGGVIGAAASLGNSSVAVSDATLSGYLRTAAGASSRAQSAAAMVEVATTLALVSHGSDGTPTPLFATLGRNWAETDSGAQRALFGAYATPWASAESLSDVVALTPVAVRLTNEPQSASRVAAVAAMIAAETSEAQFSVIAATPDALTSSRRLSLLSLLSDEWLASPTAWSKAVTGFIADTNKVVASVQVVPSSTVLITANGESLPITVSNKLSQPVTVYLQVDPTTTLISLDRAHRFEEVSLEANSQRRVEIPLQSLSNGKAGVTATLFSAGRQVIGSPVVIKVTVQAGWETIGSLVFAALIVAVFAIGIVRNVRKRIRASRE
jgi:hypothetical protein